MAKHEVNITGILNWLRDTIVSLGGNEPPPNDSVENLVAHLMELEVDGLSQATKVDLVKTVYALIQTAADTTVLQSTLLSANVMEDTYQTVAKALREFTPELQQHSQANAKNSLDNTLLQKVQRNPLNFAKGLVHSIEDLEKVSSALKEAYSTRYGEIPNEDRIETLVALSTIRLKQMSIASTIKSTATMKAVEDEEHVGDTPPGNYRGESIKPNGSHLNAAKNPPGGLRSFDEGR